MRDFCSVADISKHTHVLNTQHISSIVDVADSDSATHTVLLSTNTRIQINQEEADKLFSTLGMTRIV